MEMQYTQEVSEGKVCVCGFAAVQKIAVSFANDIRRVFFNVESESDLS